MPSGSERAVVAFSARGGGHGQFHFFRTLQPLPGVTKLLVRDPSERWYNHGLPGSEGASVGETAARIRAELDELGAARVVTAGGSMGGYAAILYGCLLEAERVVALVPQTVLDPILPQAPAAGVRLEVPDLRPIVSAAPGTAIDLVVGWDDLVDVFHALNLADLPSVRVLALPGGGHEFAADMTAADEFKPFLTDLLEGRNPDVLVPAPDFAAADRGGIGVAVLASCDGRWAEAADAIAPVAQTSSWLGGAEPTARRGGGSSLGPLSEPLKGPYERPATMDVACAVRMALLVGHGAGVLGGIGLRRFASWTAGAALSPC